MDGSSTAVCQANGTWSTPAPECKGKKNSSNLPGLFHINSFPVNKLTSGWPVAAVSCGLAPIPQFGMIIYDKMVRGNQTYFGIGGTYRCLPPLALFGNPRAECTINGTWAETPECRGTNATRTVDPKQAKSLCFLFLKI